VADSSCLIVTRNGLRRQSVPGSLLSGGRATPDPRKANTMSLTLEHAPVVATTRPTHSHPILRAAGVVALAGIFYVHLIGVSDKLSEVKYLGVGYILLMIGAAIVALALIAGSESQHRLAWMAGAVLALSTIVGFTLTRTVGLPQSMDDKGNWGEAAGIWSLIVEGAFVVLAVAALGRGKRVRSLG